MNLATTEGNSDHRGQKYFTEKKVNKQFLKASKVTILKWPRRTPASCINNTESRRTIAKSTESSVKRSKRKSLAFPSQMKELPHGKLHKFIQLIYFTVSLPSRSLAVKKLIKKRSKDVELLKTRLDSYQDAWRNWIALSVRLTIEKCSTKLANKDSIPDQGRNEIWCLWGGFIRRKDSILRVYVSESRSWSRLAFPSISQQLPVVATSKCKFPRWPSRSN